MAAEFNSSGAILLSALLPQETGYWNPVVTTGADGTATITLTVPERSTAWKFLAKGLSAETLAGEATDDLTVKKDLFGEIKLPLAFTDGDTAEIPVTVHNDAVEKGTIEVVLRTTIGGRTRGGDEDDRRDEQGIERSEFQGGVEAAGALTRRGKAATRTNHRSRTGEGPTTIRRDRTDPTDADSFELVIRAAGHEDLVQRSMPLRPYGVPVFTAASGSSMADGTVWLEAPEGMPAESAGMQILVGPTVERSLLDIVLAPAPWCQMEVGRLASGLESATSDVMASLGLQKLLGGSREAGGPEALALDSRIRGSVSLLLSAQNDDGGWSWTGTPGGRQQSLCKLPHRVGHDAGARRPATSCRTTAYNKALAYLRNQVAATDNADYESKAILLHVLAVAGQGDFALANRLYRDRNALSFGRPGPPGPELRGHGPQGNGRRDSGPVGEAEPRRRGHPPRSRKRRAALEPFAGRAAGALRLGDRRDVSPKIAQGQGTGRLAHGPSHRQPLGPGEGDRPRGAGVVPLVRRQPFHRRALQADRLRQRRAGQGARRRSGRRQPVDRRAATVPGRSRRRRASQRVNFQIAGRGRYTYQCILGGFVPADKLKSTTKHWRVKRYYEPAPLELDGREIPRGFGVLEGGVSDLPQSARPASRRPPRHGQYRSLRGMSAWNTPEERLEYLVVTEPIPTAARP